MCLQQTVTLPKRGYLTVITGEFQIQGGSWHAGNGSTLQDISPVHAHLRVTVVRGHVHYLMLRT